MFHNANTAIPAYTDLEPFQKAAYDGKVKNVSSITHELRLVKSPSELKLMREAASIGCQVPKKYLILLEACSKLCFFL